MGRDAGLHGSAEALPQMEPVGDLQQGPGCALTGGEWYSPYDDKYFTDARTLDIDHLAEAWDSGASAWTAKEREAYANDLGDDRALITVSATGNSSKADQDPSTWQPPAQCYRCQYAADGVADRSGGPGHRPHRICRTRRGPQQLPRPARHRHPRTIPRGPRPSSGVRGSGRAGPGRTRCRLAAEAVRLRSGTRHPMRPQPCSPAPSGQAVDHGLGIGRVDVEWS